MNVPVLSVILASPGFPIWLRVTHYINLLFIGLMIRSGIQILGAHPRLYWNETCKPGTQWIKFSQKKAPKEKYKLWTSMDEEVPVTPWQRQSRSGSALALLCRHLLATQRYHLYCLAVRHRRMGASHSHIMGHRAASMAHFAHLLIVSHTTGQRFPAL